jgi:hypothetical protein
MLVDLDRLIYPSKQPYHQYQHTVKHMLQIFHQNVAHFYLLVCSFTSSSSSLVISTSTTLPRRPAGAARITRKR